MKCLSLNRTDSDILLCFHLCQTWSREHRWHWVTCWTLFYDRRVSDHCQCWDNYWLLTFFLIMIQSSEQMILSTSPWCHCLINITLILLSSAVFFFLFTIYSQTILILFSPKKNHFTKDMCRVHKDAVIQLYYENEKRKRFYGYSFIHSWYL